MTDSLYSPSWYRIASLKPRLRGHLQIHRHHYRGELWYVLQDHMSGRFQRFSPAAYQLIGLMDGRRTVQEIWQLACAALADEAPSQEEVIQLLSQLHATDALQSDVVPDTAELLKRFARQRHKSVKQNLRSPMFMRFALLDPERFLDRWQFLVRPIFTAWGLALWLAVVAAGVFMAGVHWSALTLNITDRILSPGNLVVMWLTFPLLKAFHEFAHAFAVKVKGGEVHEMGIMMLVFTPIPYVDASSASGFREKRDRIVVSAAGMAAEVFIGALALFAWVNMEPGAARSVAYNVIFIAGVSSLFFNGNPLLRYDAYYILSDFLEIPNLASRGSRYVLYLLKRRLLGLDKLEAPPHTPGERVWLVAFTVLSSMYRIMVYVAILLFVAGKFFFIGVALACLGVVNMFLLPVFKVIKFLTVGAMPDRTRPKAALAVGILLAAAAAAVGLVPLPLSTIAEGVIWPPEEAFVRAGTDGFLERIAAEPGGLVKRGDPLILCSDPLLPAQIRLLEARQMEVQALYDTLLVSDRVRAEITREELGHITAKLQDALERLAELTITSAAQGVFVLPMAQDLEQAYVRRGQLLGYVLNPSAATVRVVVSQADVDLVRRRTRRISVRLPERLSRTLPAQMRREVPAATDEIPGLALSQEGGGQIALDPRQGTGRKAFQKMFLFDIALPEQTGFYSVGGRAFVRFDHGSEPVAFRWYRDLRLLFLRRFNV